MVTLRTGVLIAALALVPGLVRTGLCQNGESRPPEQPKAESDQVRSPAPKQPAPGSVGKLASINGRPYQRPTHKEQFNDYFRDSYGLPAFARTTVRSLYGEARGKPEGWRQDFPGFAQRFGSNVAITAINGNVRYGMETVFREDMRYIPCHGCSVRRKIGNALLAEVTARHDSDGRRFFTLTPAIADFSGPIIANAFWYPDKDPLQGVIGTRTVAAIRVGQHLFQEFVWERRHKDRRIEDTEPLRKPATSGDLKPRPAAASSNPPTQ